jgi:hypothetical protein
MVWASDHWVLRCLDMRARPGYGKADVASVRRDVVRVRALARDSFK